MQFPPVGDGNDDLVHVIEKMFPEHPR